ncbi:unnamed protein product [Cylicostephanus goldi]|uniref:Uncharacterized protein n=1 Tax=Cylicostephanus goldi TaxID=71465 RepID=A0A3P6TNK8_CYLGO|nr:unnamed protein product [Cylicostephanus goldi]
MGTSMTCLGNVDEFFAEMPKIPRVPSAKHAEYPMHLKKSALCAQMLDRIFDDSANANGGGNFAAKIPNTIS